MLSRFYQATLLILLLRTFFYCATCAPLQKPCIPCALSCDDALELKQHQRVQVVVGHQSVDVLDETHTVSNLLEGGCCYVVVPDCFKWGTGAQFILRLYANDNEQVFEPFYVKRDSMPVCVSEGTPNTRDDADRNLSNKLLILLPVCLCIFF